MEYVDQHPHCGLWYKRKESISQFSFANSQQAKCKEKIVIYMYDKDYAEQATEFDIVEQGNVPFLMSLPQMRNLRFRLDLSPTKAILNSSPLGIKNLELNISKSSHLVF